MVNQLDFAGAEDGDDDEEEKAAVTKYTWEAIDFVRSLIFVFLVLLVLFFATFFSLSSDKLQDGTAQLALDNIGLLPDLDPTVKERYNVNVTCVVTILKELANWPAKWQFTAGKRAKLLAILSVHPKHLLDQPWTQWVSMTSKAKSRTEELKQMRASLVDAAQQVWTLHTLEEKSAKIAAKQQQQEAKIQAAREASANAARNAVPARRGFDAGCSKTTLNILFAAYEGVHGNSKLISRTPLAKWEVTMSRLSAEDLKRCEPDVPTADMGTKAEAFCKKRFREAQADIGKALEDKCTINGVSYLLYKIPPPPQKKIVPSGGRSSEDEESELEDPLFDEFGMYRDELEDHNDSAFDSIISHHCPTGLYDRYATIWDKTNSKNYILHHGKVEAKARHPVVPASAISAASRNVLAQSMGQFVELRLQTLKQQQQQQEQRQANR